MIDFGCDVSFSGIRRKMTGTGNRNWNGEQVRIASGGTNWTKLASPTTFGWEDYILYGSDNNTWRNVPYGWSAWLRPNTVQTVRYVAFWWDGNNDTVDEIEIDSTMITSDRSGVSGTTKWDAFDDDISTGFDTGYNNWQYLSIDFGEPVVFTRIRRHMSGTGLHRGPQGEAVKYSNDLTTWGNLTGATTSGWESYNNYVPHAWHSVDYGWSDWLVLDVPVSARYVRFHWDGNSDTLDELEIDQIIDGGDSSYDFVHTDQTFEDGFSGHIGSFMAGATPIHITYWSSGARHAVGFTGSFDGRIYGNGSASAYLALRDDGSEVRGKLTIQENGLGYYSGSWPCGNHVFPIGSEINVRMEPWTSYDGRFSAYDNIYYPAYGDTRHFATGSTTRRVETPLGDEYVTFTMYVMLQVNERIQNPNYGPFLVGEIEIDVPSPCVDGSIYIFMRRRDVALGHSLGYY